MGLFRDFQGPLGIFQGSLRDLQGALGLRSFGLWTAAAHNGSVTCISRIVEIRTNVGIVLGLAVILQGPFGNPLGCSRDALGTFGTLQGLLGTFRNALGSFRDLWESLGIL